MKRILFIVTFMTASVAVFGQVKFEEGYFISTEGQRTACQIRNVDWRNNPKSFEYRLGADGESKEVSNDQVVEFGVTNGSTFKRFAVKIDRSTSDLTRMTYNRNPEFVDETLFLRVLIEGKGSLYEYSEDKFLRYFYTVDQSLIQQLVFKTYMATSVDATQNETYKQQLFNDLKCSSLSKNDLERANYARKDLMRVFTKFNACDGTQAFTTKEPDHLTDAIHLSLRPGLTFNSLQLTNSLSSAANADFSNALSFQFGVELEDILPFNKGTWSIIVEPVFQTYKNETRAGATTVKVDYTSLDINLGIRRYFFTKGSGKWYASAGGAYALPFSSTIQDGSASPLEISSGINMTLGAGYTANRLSFELRYAFRRGILGNYLYYSSNYSGPTLIVGYRLF